MQQQTKAAETWEASARQGTGTFPYPSRTCTQAPHVAGTYRPRNERRPPTFPLSTRAAGASAPSGRPDAGAI